MLILAVLANAALTLILISQLATTHHNITERITMTAQELIDQLTDVVRKVAVEINAKIADLNLQIQDAGVADKVDLTELTAAVQVLDDIVPDAVENNPPF